MASSKPTTAFDLSNLTGRVKLNGADGWDLLNRLSATDLDPLRQRPPRPTPAVLTDERGHIVSAFTAIMAPDGALTLAVYDPDPQAVMQAINKYVILEDATCADATAATVHLACVGAAAPKIVEELSSACGAVGFASCYRDAYPERVDALVPRERMPDCLKLLDRSGVELGTPAQYQRLCVRRGWQQAGAELTASYNPLEAGLRHLISFTKGCYPGQEVIARLDTYNKVQRALMRVRHTGQIKRADAITAHGARCGTVTSVSDEYALGYVKLRLLGPRGLEQPLTIGGSEFRAVLPERV